MDPISVILLLAGAGTAAKLAMNNGYFTRNSRLLAQYRERHRRIRHHQQQVATMQARQFQAAILSLSTNPDFQRVAAAVAAAEKVPSSFKLRQYHRFRPHFIRHYRRCVQRGGDLQQLRESLEQLVLSFELEPFEADYLRTEAEHNMPPRQRQDGVNPVDNFRTRLSQVQEEHEQRKTAIRELTGVSDDVREQLMEAEERRYQSRLFQDGGGDL